MSNEKTAAVGKVDVSIVVAIYNEEESIPLLCERLYEVMRESGLDYEVLLIDDGSGDGSWTKLRQAAETYPSLRLVRFRRNFGQTAAISAGFNMSRGDVVVTMDADLQNDPADIPLLLARMKQGFDVVSGWRKDRHDRFLDRRLPSIIANYLISRITGVFLHDYGCTLKAYRREIVKNMELYGEMHRFMPALASWIGGRIDEMPVRHHARRFGKSKYGISRTFKVVLDLMTVKFLLSYMTRPIHVFGRLGLFFGLASLTLFMLVVGDRIWHPEWMGEEYLLKRPFWVITPMMLMGFCLQFICIGLLAEMQTRTYHEAQKKPVYVVLETAESKKTSGRSEGGTQA